MNNFFDDVEIKTIDNNLAGKNAKVVIPEGEDDNVIDALEFINNINFVLLGDKKIIESKINLKFGNLDKLAKVQIIEPKEFLDDELVELFVEKRNGKLSKEEAEKLIIENNYYGTMLLEAGRVDALVGGCVYTTADILKPAFQIIKPKPGSKIVSSVFIMKKGDETLLFSDCAVNINPNKEQIKEITLQTLETAYELNMDPKVAMLSYSTKKSGTGEYVDLMVDAYDELIKENPKLSKVIDGELQFDAAYVERVGNKKAPNSDVAGRANVFIFPHLMAGNIAYKVAQYMGGYEAVGPLLQGLNKPVNDLSRGTNGLTIAKVSYLALRNIK